MVMKLLILYFSLLLISYNSIAQIPTDHLEVYYPFTGNANDSSGNGKNATVLGATLTTDRFGNLNSAYDFDGINDYINTFSAFDLPVRAISFWAKPNTINGSGFNSDAILVQDNIAHSNGIIVAHFQNSTLQLNVGGTTSYNDSSISANTWIHVIMQRRTDSTFYYVNGSPVGTGISGDLGSATTPYNYLVIGTDRTRNRRFFDGVIDDIRIYSDVLTECEIASLYNEGTGIFDLSISQAGNTMISNEANASYQWINCDTDSIIPGATNQSLTVTQSGNFAVILDNGTCIDTSACVSIISVGLEENKLEESFTIYPNPIKDKFTIDLEKNYSSIQLTIMDANGKIVQSNNYNNQRLIKLSLNTPAGVYFLKVDLDKEPPSTIQLVKD